MLAPATIAVSLTFLLACAVKLTVLLASAYAIAFALRRRSSALRHHVWATAIFGSLFLPVLILLLPGWHSATLGTAAAALMPSHEAASNSAASIVSSTTVDATTSWPLVSKFALAILLLWFLGFSLAVLRLVVGLARLAWVSVRSKPIFEDVWMREALDLSHAFKISRSVRLLECRSALAMPLTCGLLRPIIILPAGAAQWSEECRRIVLAHELAHIARHDWFLQSVPNSPAPCTGSTLWSGLPPQAFDTKASAPATMPFCARVSRPPTTPASYSISQGHSKTPAADGQLLWPSRARQILKGDLPLCLVRRSTVVICPLRRNF